MSFMEDGFPTLMEPTQFVTCIDNRFQTSDIANLNLLPTVIRKEIESVNEIRSHGFQELNGYHERQVMFSCGGYWTYPTFMQGMKVKREGFKEKFVVTSYGSHNYQWDGETLRNTVKVYV